MSLSLLSFDQLAAATLVALAWQGALLTIAAALVLRLLPRISAAARFYVWAVLFLILVLLPFIPHTQKAGAASGVHVAPWWSVLLALLWAGLSLLRAAQITHAFLRLRAVCRGARPLPIAATSSARNAALCLSSDVLRPSVVGFFHPKILIPDALYARLTPAELEHILLHEQQHLRRRDDWLNLLQKFGLVLFPLNPALLWVERRLCFERELACDESVLASTGAPESYARSLVSLAEHTLLGRQFSLALGAWGQPSELTQRVHRILAFRTPTLNPRLATTALALLCTGLAGAAASLARSPHLISFTSPAVNSSMSASNAMMVPHTERTRLELAAESRDIHSTVARPTWTPAVMHVAQRSPVAGERIRPLSCSRHAFRGRRTGVKPRPAALPTLLATGAVSADEQTFASAPQRVTLRSIARRGQEHETEFDQRTALGLQPAFTLDAPQLANPEWRDANSSAFVVTLFTAYTTSPAYATIRMPNGWLVIQL